MRLVNPMVPIDVVDRPMFIGRLEIVAGTLNRLDHLIQRCRIKVRCSLLIEPAAGQAKGTLFTFGFRSLVMAGVAAIGKIDLALDIPASILQQVGGIRY